MTCDVEVQSVFTNICLVLLGSFFDEWSELARDVEHLLAEDNEDLNEIAQDFDLHPALLERLHGIFKTLFRIVSEIGNIKKMNVLQSFLDTEWLMPH